MFFVWLQRLILLALIIMGGLFALENRHEVLLNIGGDAYAISAYLVVFVVLALGFIGGALLSRLSTLVDVKKDK